MNRVVLMGRLTRDPEVRYSQQNEPIARYTIAVDRGGKTAEGEPSADFISCVAFAKSAEFAEKYLRKGLKIAVEGRIRTGSYTNKEGQKVYTTDVIVDRHEFCESKNATNAEGNANPNYQGASAPDSGFMNIPEGIDEELPFG